MSIASVATRGYGTWGSVNLVPTLGYGIGAAVAILVYTRIGTLSGASRAIGRMSGSTMKIGTAGGASKMIGTLTGTNP